LVLTDPPYGISYDSSHQKYLNGLSYHPAGWDKAPFDPAPVLALDLPTIMWGGNNYASRLPDKGGWLCWIKTARDDAGIRQADMELAWTNCVTRPRVYHHLWIGAYRESESGQPNYHPTQKPLALMRWCITLQKGVRAVLDPYMGSGTTLRAAKDLGLKAIGIEREEAYCEIAARRMAQQVLDLGPIAAQPEQMVMAV